jgi:hypothetical protein
MARGSPCWTIFSSGRLSSTGAPIAPIGGVASACRMFYYVINVFFSYFLVGSFFLSFGLLLRNAFPDDVTSKDEVNDLFTLGDTLLKLYFTCLIVCSSSV